MDIKAPARNMEQEATDTLNTQIALAPKQLAAQQQYGPGFADVGVQNFMRSLQGPNGNDGLLDAYSNVIAPRMAAADAASATAARGADVGDLERYGPRAVSAIQAADPRQQELMGELNRQAMEGLQLGSKLDPSLRREVAQSVRAGQSARGFGLGTNDLAEEAMFTGLRADQLRQQRQGFAQSVSNQNAAQAVDPFLAIIGRPSKAANPALLNAGVGSAMQNGQGFDPYNPYAQDWWDTRYNAKTAAKIATGNANSALWGAGIEAVGSLAGAAIGCWVARAVYGETDLRWLEFRQWLFTKASEKFRNWYLQNGERYAVKVKKSERLRRIWLRFMNAKRKEVGYAI